MATLKQKRAIEKTLENGGNVSMAMREVGYSESTVNNPANLTTSKGYMALLFDYGLTEGLITRALVEDIKTKKGRRTQELALGAELLGMRKMGVVIANQFNIENQQVEKLLQIDPTNPKVLELMRALEEEVGKGRN